MCHFLSKRKGSTRMLVYKPAEKSYFDGSEYFLSCQLFSICSEKALKYFQGMLLVPLLFAIPKSLTCHLLFTCSISKKKKPYMFGSLHNNQPTHEEKQFSSSIN